MHWNDECDVLVVGSGAGGCTGAYTAAREGLSTILVEATDRVGGIATYSGGGGMWFPCNAALQRSGDTDTMEDALTYYHAVVGERTPFDLQETYVRSGAPLIDYLEQDGDFKFVALPWPDYFGKAPKAKATGRHITAKPLPASAIGDLRNILRPWLGADWLGQPLPDTLVGGQALIGRFLLAMSKLPNLRTELDCPCEELIVEGGAVVGAVVNRAGQRTTVRAKQGVLLSAGGFERNDELRARYGVPGQARDSMATPGSQGKALMAAIAVGADTDLMDQAWWAPGLTHPGGNSAFALWFTGGIFVDDVGQRFVNESAAYDRLGREIIDHMNQGALTLPYWMVYDGSRGIVPPVKATNVPMVEPEKYIEAGLWKSADTLEELAALIDVPAQALEETVARYNRFVEAGVDEDFGRGDEAYDRAFSGGKSPLSPIVQSPFNAAAFGISDLGTKGGLRTNTAGQVFDTTGELISGLYAAGNSMAAPSGTTYPGGGNPIGTSMVFSHLAVCDMIRQHIE